MTRFKFSFIVFIISYIISIFGCLYYNDKNREEITCIVTSDVQYVSYQVNPYSICDCYDYKTNNKYQLTWEGVVRKNQRLIIQEGLTDFKIKMINFIIGPVIISLLVLFLGNIFFHIKEE